MVDVLSKKQRELNMRRIRSKDTKPELILRRALHADGYRYTKNVSSLPGSPDIVFSRRKKVIFVNGCFWHSHECVWGQVVPATNATFWSEKRQATVERDARKRDDLQAKGWRVATVWECELRRISEILPEIRKFLGPARCQG